MRWQAILVAFIALAVATVAAGSDTPTLAPTDVATFQEIRALILDHSGYATHERSGAARALSNLAARYEELPGEVRGLLEVLASDPDPQIASLASRELARATAPQADSVAPRTLDDVHRAELQAADALLSDLESHERSGVGRYLVNLAGTYRAIPDDLQALLDRASRDLDPEVSVPVQQFLSRVNGSPQETRLVLTLSDEAEEAFRKSLDELRQPDAEVRRHAVSLLRDMPLPPYEASLRVDALQAAVGDLDPMVRHDAAFALAGGLSGEPEALAQVFIGGGDLKRLGETSFSQPVSPQNRGNGRNPDGYVTASGVFVSTELASDPSMEASQPVRPAQESGSQDISQPGYINGSGVFISLLPVVDSVGSDPQPPS